MKSYRIIDTMARDKAKTVPCIVCARFGSEGHHVNSRASGGDDVEWNLMPLCRICHTAIHKAGLSTYAKKYKQVENWLLANGWELNKLLNKWRHND